ncbi:MAG: hypothetical protein PSY12_05240 [bacterium]|nr:hypothetical protein [bacterium]
MPIVFPQVEMWIAKGMLWLAVALLFLSAVLWVYGLRKPSRPSPASTMPKKYSTIEIGGRLGEGNFDGINHERDAAFLSASEAGKLNIRNSRFANDDGSKKPPP